MYICIVMSGLQCFVSETDKSYTGLVTSTAGDRVTDSFCWIQRTPTCRFW